MPDDNDRGPWGNSYSSRYNPFPGLRQWLHGLGRVRWAIVIGVGVLILALGVWRSL